MAMEFALYEHFLKYNSMEDGWVMELEKASLGY